MRSVRFEGAHLLSSKPACELLVEGRALVGISLLVKFEPVPDSAYIIPIRINLERDYVSVFTGLGSWRPDASRQLQRLLVERVEAAFERGIQDRHGLNKLANAIYERARRDKPVDRADILAPARPWTDDA